jgi:hypothetical protein
MRPEGGSEWTGAHKEGVHYRRRQPWRKPSRYDPDDFDCGWDEEDEALEVRQGMTEGWADVYDWYLEGQYIELKDCRYPATSVLRPKWIRKGCSPR